MALAFEANIYSDANCKSFAQLFQERVPVLNSEQLPGGDYPSTALKGSRAKIRRTMGSKNSSGNES